MKRHPTPEQIVHKLREGERMLNEGKAITEVMRHLGIAESTWNRWRNQYGGMKADEAKRLRQLESENARLKNCSPSPSSTRRCSRSWPRKASDPGAPTSGRRGRDGALRSLRAPGLSRRRPAPLHRAPGSPARPRRRGQTAADPSGPSSTPIPAGAGRRPMRSCAGRDGPSTASPGSACGDLRASGGPHGASAGDAVPTPGRSCSGRASRQVWALDFPFDETADQRRLQLLNVVDEHTREALAMRVGRSCDAEHVVAVIESLVATRAAPDHLRMGQRSASSWPGRCGTGAGRPERPRPTSNPARHGRTRSSNASTAGYATSCSTSRSSPPRRGAGRCRSISDRVQRLPTSLLPGRHDPRPVRQAVDRQPASAPVAARPVTEVQSGL